MDDLVALICQAQQGDTEAYAQLVRRFHRVALAYGYARLGDFHLAEDVAQEAFLHAFFELPRLHTPRGFAGWFRRIVVKYCDRLTRRKRVPVVALEGSLDLADLSYEPLTLLEQHERRSELARAIALLPAHERESVVLCYLADQSQGEVAAFLGVPVTTVRKRLQSARARLRRRLGASSLPGVAHAEAETRDAFVHALKGAQVMEQETAFVQHVTTAIAAIKAGNREQLATLLAAHPALVHTRSADGRSLLGHLTDFPAKIAAGPALVQALVEAGAVVDDLALTGGETPLQWAVSANDVAVAAALLDAGAAVDGPYGDGRPLAQALFYGQRAAAELLVQRGARITLEYAAGLGRLDLVQACFDPAGRLLPEAGAHCPPVSHAIPPSSEPHAELLEQALVYAAINGQVAVIDELVRRGTALNALPSGFDIRLTPLHWAVVRDQVEAVQALLAHGANSTIRDPRHQATALAWARYHKLERVAAVLNTYGAIA